MPVVGGITTKVEIAFNSGYSTAAGSRTWTDVTAYVDGEEGITITRGRADEVNDVDPSKLVVVLDNTDGRFSPEYASGAYYPDVKRGRPIRVTSTHNSVTYDRFLGFIDDYQIGWPDGTHARSTVTLSASSRLARLAAGMELRTLVEEEILRDDPVAFYPLSEDDVGEGVTQTAGSVAADVAPSLVKYKKGTNSNISWSDLLFGAGTGPVADDLTCPSWAPYTDTNGYYLQASPWSAGSTTVIRAELFFKMSANTRDMVMLFLGDTNSYPSFQIFLQSDGKVSARIYTAAGTFVETETANAYDDGAVHHYAVHITSGSGSSNGTGQAYIDGLSVTAVTTFPVFTLAPTKLIIGGGRVAADLFGEDASAGQLAHVAIGYTTISQTRVIAHYDAGVTGFAGDTPGERIERLGLYADVATAEMDLASGQTPSLIMQDTNGSTVLDLMNEVVSTENGTLLDGRDGHLIFQGRDFRYGSSPDFTLDAEADEVEADLEPRYDDQFLVNDCTVTRAETVAGSTVESYTAKDQTSIDDYGPYRQTLESLAATSGEIIDAATWRVAKYKDPHVRVPSVAVELIGLTDTALVADLLTDGIGNMFTLDNLPAQAPSSSLDLIIEGYSETISEDSHRIGFYVSPASLSQVWTVQDATYGVYDTYPIAY